MNERSQDIQLIEKFLDGKMTAEEKRIFDERRSNDHDFDELLHDMDLLVEGIKESATKSTKEEKLERLRFFAEIMGAEETEPNPVKVIPLYQKAWLWAAAASIGLAVISYLLWNQPSDPSLLYAKNFVPYGNVFEPTVRGAETSHDARASAFRAYDNRDYAKATLLFSELVKVKEEPAVLLLLGNANLSLGNYEAAEKNFTTLIQDFDELDVQGKWYLSLCYLKTGKAEQARVLLHELGNADVSYSPKAKELLKKLE